MIQPDIGADDVYVDLGPRKKPITAPAFNAPSVVIPITLTVAPATHLGAQLNCVRCQWGAREGALGVHVLKRH